MYQFYQSSQVEMFFRLSKWNSNSVNGKVNSINTKSVQIECIFTNCKLIFGLRFIRRISSQVKMKKALVDFFINVWPGTLFQD